jgi:hypothetical protein
MKTQFLLAACLSLIVGSVFVAPETTWFGVSPVLALDLSRILLLMGIITGALTVNSEARDIRENRE